MAGACLADLLAPAIAQAKEGTIVTRSQADVTSEKLPELKDAPGFADVFLIDDKPPAAGARVRQIALAATLDHLIHAGRPSCSMREDCSTRRRQLRASRR